MSPPAKGLRERNKENKLARIERAARRLFSEQGYDQTTTRQIARRAGIGAGTLFVYFPEKRDLLFHLFREDVRAVKQAALAELRDGHVIERLMSMFERYIEYYARDTRLSRAYIKELPFVSDRERPDTTAINLELMTALSGIVEEAQRAGEIDPSLSPVQATYPAAALYLTGLMSWLGGTIPSRDAVVAILRSSLEVVYRGLAPRVPGDPLAKPT